MQDLRSKLAAIRATEVITQRRRMGVCGAEESTALNTVWEDLDEKVTTKSGPGKEKE